MFQDLHINAGLLSGRYPKALSYALTFGTVRYQAVFLFRLAQMVGNRSAVLGLFLKQFNHLLTGADIAWQATIGEGLVLFHPTGVVIGPDVTIGSFCEIQQGVTLGGSGRVRHGLPDSPQLSNGVKIGAGARILGNVSVGKNVTVGANAVVITDVPDNTVAVGVPAKALKRPAASDE